MLGNDSLSLHYCDWRCHSTNISKTWGNYKTVTFFIALAKRYFNIFSWIRSAFWTSDNMECSRTLIMHAIWAFWKCARAWFGFMECSSSRWFLNKTLPLCPVHECLRRSQMLHNVNRLEQTKGNWTITFPQRQSKGYLKGIVNSKRIFCRFTQKDVKVIDRGCHSFWHLLFSTEEESHIGLARHEQMRNFLSWFWFINIITTETYRMIKLLWSAFLSSVWSSIF